MPMALLRREPNGPDFFLVGLFPGTIRDCGERLRLSAHLSCIPSGPHLPLGPCHRALKPTGDEQERIENVLSGGLPDRWGQAQRGPVLLRRTHSMAVLDLSPRRAGLGLGH